MTTTSCTHSLAAASTQASKAVSGPWSPHPSCLPHLFCLLPELFRCCLPSLCSSPDLPPRPGPSPDKPSGPPLGGPPQPPATSVACTPCAQPSGASARSGPFPSRSWAGRAPGEAGAGAGTSSEPAEAKQAGSQGGHLPRRLGYVGRYLGCCNIHEGKIRYLNLFSNKCVSVGEHSSC